jgi:DNA-binding MarR family transcriptional regulator
MANHPRSEDEPTSPVADVIRSAMADLSASELKVARALLAQYPAAGLGSAAGLAERAGVSAPTVVRFIARLGYGGYRDFQRILRDEVQRERTASPLTLPERVAGNNLRVISAHVFTETISRTFADLPDSELDRAVALLADTGITIWSFGGRYSQVLATYRICTCGNCARELASSPTRPPGAPASCSTSAGGTHAWYSTSADTNATPSTWPATRTPRELNCCW